MRCWYSLRSREYHLIDLDGTKVQGLREIIGDREDVFLYHGNCNELLLRRVFPRIQYKDFRRGLCLLDPYKLTRDWQVVREAGAMQSVDIFINFPIHDINRTVLHHRRDGVSEANIARMNAFWGDESWKKLAYDENPTLFGEVESEKVSNARFAEEYRKRLQAAAGFKRVPAPLAMRNSKGSTVYYLFFASQKGTAEEIVLYIFDKFGKQSI